MAYNKPVQRDGQYHSNDGQNHSYRLAPGATYGSTILHATGYPELQGGMMAEGVQERAYLGLYMAPEALIAYPWQLGQTAVCAESQHIRH